MQHTALSREEKNASIKEKADSQLGALPVGSQLVYSDGGADGNGANGQHSACGFGVVVTEKQADRARMAQPLIHLPRAHIDLEYLYDYYWAMYGQAETKRSKPKGQAKEVEDVCIS